MALKKGTTIELTVENIVYGGRGLAHDDNMAVFINKAIPGERVRAQVIRVKKNFAEAKLLDLIEPSPHRISAPCPYSGYCGGCNWQFVEYEKQLEFKQGFVEDSLNHLGKVTGFAMHEVVPAARIFGYRNKMEFSFSDRRWYMPQEKDEKHSDNDCALGLHVPGTFDKIIDIDRCLLQGEKGNEILREVKRFVKHSEIPVYGLKSHQGFWRYLVLRHSHSFDEWMVNIVTSEEGNASVRALAVVLMERFKEIATIVNSINSRRGGTAIGEWEKILEGNGNIRDKIGPFTFEISAHSFFQTNTVMAERLYETVRGFAHLTGKETVFDLYCGTGTISIFLAPDVTRIIGMDISKSAIEDARRNCRLNGIDNSEFYFGDVKELLGQVSHKPDVLITDPPRTGMHKKVIDQILGLLPDKIVYISCNPTTLARDVALLTEHYRLEEVQPLDLFPNTYHVESVARLKRV